MVQIHASEHTTNNERHGERDEMALTKVRGVWRDLGFSDYRGAEGSCPESESANLTKAEDAKLSAFLSRYPFEQKVRKWGLSPMPIHRNTARGSIGRFISPVTESEKGN